MIKITALTQGPPSHSCSRFRVRQYIEPLSSLGIQINEYVPIISTYQAVPPKDRLPEWMNSGIYNRCLRYIWQGKKIINRIPGILASQTSDITWLQREIIPFRFTLEPLLKHPLVFDVDDVIWQFQSSSYSYNSVVGQRVAQSIAKIAKCADVVIVGNSYLAQWFSDYSSNIRIIPTAVDTERYKPLVATNNQSKKFTIGWIGSDANIQYLYGVETPLKHFLRDFADSEILIVSDKPPSFRDLSNDQVRYIAWSPEVEVQAIQQMDIGIMPLVKDGYTIGKCSLKMLQYMACGLPVVVSPVGMNAEVLALGNLGLGVEKESDWYDALVVLYQHRERGNQYGREGRRIVEDYFSQKVIVKELASIFKELA